MFSASHTHPEQHSLRFLPHFRSHDDLIDLGLVFGASYGLKQCVVSPITLGLYFFCISRFPSSQPRQGSKSRDSSAGRGVALVGIRSSVPHPRASVPELSRIDEMPSEYEHSALSSRDQLNYDEDEDESELSLHSESDSKNLLGIAGVRRSSQSEALRAQLEQVGGNISLSVPLSVSVLPSLPLYLPIST